MATVFDALKPMSFDGVKFPYQELRIVGGLRDHVHEFPHVDGGSPEKLGRKLYEISVTANFQAALASKDYRGLWPADLTYLRAQFEQEITADLHIPTIGTIKAYCVSWIETARAMNRSGVTMDLVFREDENSVSAVVNSILVNPGDFTAALDTFIGVDMTDYSTSSTNLFDGIAQLGDAILSIKDQFDLYGSLVEGKIESLVRLLDEADQQVRELNEPTQARVLDALHDLWLSAIRLQKDTRQRFQQLQEYVTPIEMGISSVARAVGIRNPAEIMQLNAIVDPLAIPPGTRLRYYAQAA